MIPVVRFPLVHPAVMIGYLPPQSKDTAARRDWMETFLSNMLNSIKVMKVRR